MSDPVSWHDWCWKPIGVDPRRGGCPCPKTQQEWRDRLDEAEKRHEAAVEVAFTAALRSLHDDAEVPATSAGAWLRNRAEKRVHFFEPGEGRSRCGKVSRALSSRPAKRAERQCQLCQRHERRPR